MGAGSALCGRDSAPGQELSANGSTMSNQLGTLKQKRTKHNTAS